MSKIKEILEELDKGEYNRFTDQGLLSEELMRDFKVSHTLAVYAATMFIHHNSKNCYNCNKYINHGFGWVECDIISKKYCVDIEYCNQWEQKERPRIMGK